MVSNTRSPGHSHSHSHNTSAHTDTRTHKHAQAHTPTQASTTTCTGTSHSCTPTPTYVTKPAAIIAWRGRVAIWRRRFFTSCAQRSFSPLSLPSSASARSSVCSVFCSWIFSASASAVPAAQCGERVSGQLAHGNHGGGYVWLCSVRRPKSFLSRVTESSSSCSSSCTACTPTPQHALVTTTAPPFTRTQPQPQPQPPPQPCTDKHSHSHTAT